MIKSLYPIVLKFCYHIRYLSLAPQALLFPQNVRTLALLQTKVQQTHATGCHLELLAVGRDNF